MLSKTTGIILRTLKYRETSLILDVYTLHHGMQSYIISGIRSKRSKTKTGLLQIPNLVDLIAYHKGKGTLQRIKEVKSHQLYMSIPFEIAKSTMSMFLTEVCQKAIKEEEPNPGLFEFVKTSFLFLDHTQSSIANFHIVFLVKLSERLGFKPTNNYSDEKNCFDLMEGVFIDKESTSLHFLNSELSHYLSLVLNTSYESMHELKIPKSIRMQILDGLLNFYKIHSEQFGEMKSLSILKEILS